MTWLVNHPSAPKVYLNEIQRPWFLSHHSPSILPVSSAPPSNPPVKRRSLRVPPDSARRTASRGEIRSQPLYLQNLFGTNVRLVRFARGLSQEDLADLASLDRTYISAIERRLRNVSIQNIQRLAIALRVDPRELLDPALSDDPRYETAQTRTRRS